MSLENEFISEKNDDFGTLFYKLRNGNLPFEYDTEIQLKKISEAIERNNKDLTCGLISAVLANYIDKKNYFNNDVLGFLFFLFVSYFVLELVIYITRKIYERIIFFVVKKRVSEIDEEEIQDYFYKKIVVQTTYVFSVIKRSKDIKQDETKKDLYKMYTIQGMYGIRKIGVELAKIVNSTSKYKFNKYIDAIGKERMIEVLDILQKCIQDIGDLDSSVFDEMYSDKLRINGLREKINET